MFIYTDNATKLQPDVLCYRTVTDTTEDNAGHTTLSLGLERASEAGGVGLTHPYVSEAALSQLPFQKQRLPGNFPGISPKTHCEGGGVGTGLGQVITQAVVSA